MAMPSAEGLAVNFDDLSMDYQGERSDGPLGTRWSEGRMYAIAFDLDTVACKRVYPGPDYRHAYRDIQVVLEEFGFWNEQGSVYYSSHAKSVRVAQAVIEIQRRHPWFRESVRSLRVLRIDENDDLLPLLGQPELPINQPASRRSGRRNSNSHLFN